MDTILHEEKFLFKNHRFPERKLEITFWLLASAFVVNQMKLLHNLSIINETLIAPIEERTICLLSVSHYWSIGI
jgi:hypothetical protein